MQSTVTVSIATLKTEFRRAFPDKTVHDIAPIWRKFWAGITETEPLPRPKTGRPKIKVEEP